MRVRASPLVAAALVFASVCAEEQRDMRGRAAPPLAGPVWVGVPVSLDAVKGNAAVLAFWNGDAPC